MGFGCFVVALGAINIPNCPLVSLTRAHWRNCTNTGCWESCNGRNTFSLFALVSMGTFTKTLADPRVFNTVSAPCDDASQSLIASAGYLLSSIIHWDWERLRPWKLKICLDRLLLLHTHFWRTEGESWRDRNKSGSHTHKHTHTHTHIQRPTNPCVHDVAFKLMHSRTFP